MTNDLFSEKIKEVIEANRYESAIHVPGQGVCVIAKFAFTWAVMVGIEPSGYNRRYCFEFKNDAVESLQNWSGSGHVEGPWIKCKGNGMDLLNPNIFKRVLFDNGKIQRKKN